MKPIPMILKNTTAIDTAIATGMVLGIIEATQVYSQ